MLTKIPCEIFVILKHVILRVEIKINNYKLNLT